MKKTEEAKQTPLTLVRDKISELRKERQEELELIETMQQKAREDIALAEVHMKEASEALDADKFEQSEADKKKAETALKMYDSREYQIRRKEYLTEQESDAIIDSLLGYEHSLNATLRVEIYEHVPAMRKALEAYTAEVELIERTIVEWTNTIHANYRSRGRSLYTTETGEQTDRSPNPIPVHIGMFVGSPEAIRLSEYLTKIDEVPHD